MHWGEGTSSPLDHSHCYCEQTTGRNYQCCMCGEVLQKTFHYQAEPTIYRPEAISIRGVWVHGSGLRFLSYGVPWAVYGCS